MSHRRLRRLAPLVATGLLVAVPAASAAGPPPLGPNDSSPHNMGFCSPYLGGGGLGVRPDINHLLAQYGELFGYANPGDLYRDRAASTTDRACLPRETPTP